ncbi:MAG: hypothetical protein M1834_004741 [Cirrosporium novae-zelandiae]|nr:MAG: hypothetical protein M1834_004741 [Cirrosporium novae-zelandiae]
MVAPVLSLAFAAVLFLSNLAQVNCATSTSPYTSPYPTSPWANSSTAVITSAPSLTCKSGCALSAQHVTSIFWVSTIYTYTAATVLISNGSTTTIPNNSSAYLPYSIWTEYEGAAGDTQSILTPGTTQEMVVSSSTFTVTYPTNYEFFWSFIGKNISGSATTTEESASTPTTKCWYTMSQYMLPSVIAYPVTTSNGWDHAPFSFVTIPSAIYSDIPELASCDQGTMIGIPTGKVAVSYLTVTSTKATKETTKVSTPTPTSEVKTPATSADLTPATIEANSLTASEAASGTGGNTPATSVDNTPPTSANNNPTSTQINVPGTTQATTPATSRAAEETSTGGGSEQPSSEENPTSVETTPAAGQTTNVANPTSVAAGGGGATETQAATIAPAVITIGTTAYTANTGDEFTIGTQTLAPGPSAITVGGTTVSLAMSGTAVVVGSNTIALTTAAPAVTTAAVIIVSGTTISLAPSATQAVIAGSTVPLATATITYTPASTIIAGLLTIGSTTYTATGSNTYIISPQTLTPGGIITVSGTTISLSPSGSQAIIDGSTTQFISSTTLTPTEAALLTLPSQTFTKNASGDFVIGSQTLTPGGVITVSGTVISLDSAGSVAVMGGSTEVLDFTAVVTVRSSSSSRGGTASASASVAVTSAAVSAAGASSSFSSYHNVGFGGETSSWWVWIWSAGLLLGAIGVEVLRNG